MFDNQGNPIIGFYDSSALPLISHTSTGTNIYGTLHSKTSLQPGTSDFLQAPLVDLDGIPLKSTLLEEKPIDSLTLLHDHQEMTYHKTPDPASATVPEINELKSLIVTAEPLPPHWGIHYLHGSEAGGEVGWVC